MSKIIQNRWTEEQVEFLLKYYPNPNFETFMRNYKKKFGHSRSLNSAASKVFKLKNEIQQAHNSTDQKENTTTTCLKWTEEEDQFIQKNWIYSAEKLSQLLKSKLGKERTPSAIKNRLIRFNITASDNARSQGITKYQKNYSKSSIKIQVPKKGLKRRWANFLVSLIPQ